MEAGTDGTLVNVRFYSKKIINIKKIFNYFNFHFAKELILINSRSFDEVKEQKTDKTVTVKSDYHSELELNVDHSVGTS